MNPMLVLILGLLIFFGTHSVRIFADGWRSTMITLCGEWGWKALIAVASLFGFYLVIVGFGAARAAPMALWVPPLWTRHLAALLTLPAFVLFAAAYIPGNRLKTAIGHPLLAGTKLWALAHLLANGNLSHVLLFGSFLIWAAISLRNSRRRDLAEGRTYPAGPMSRTIIAVATGFAAWALFALKLHGTLIGVRPFG